MKKDKKEEEEDEEDKEEEKKEEEKKEEEDKRDKTKVRNIQDGCKLTNNFTASHFVLRSLQCGVMC